VAPDKLLLHACCAPCSCYPLEILKDSYDITFLYYNPNISIHDEYVRRRDELIRLSQIAKIDLIEGDYNVKTWVAQIKAFSELGEGSKRCHLCYRIRMEFAFQTASNKKTDIVGTVLSVSPHKSSGIIRDIGYDLQSKYGIKFLDIDFKKNDGFKKGSLISMEHGFYRQDYCGCIYSLLERKKDSGWRKKVEQVHRGMSESAPPSITSVKPF
jgi:predicted adenine nucleotide alpha hydrolase (AANH) superfamily ATPase